MPVVDVAEVNPHACLQCRGTIGPFLDTAVDIHNERLYLCMLCLRLDAAEVGFAEGERMDELTHAKDVVEHVESEVQKRDRELREVHDTLKARDKSVSQLVETVEQLEGQMRRKDQAAGEAVHMLRCIFEPDLVREPDGPVGVSVAG